MARFIGTGVFAVLFVCSLCGIAQAGFVVDEFVCEFPDDPSGTNHVWDFMGPEEAGNPHPGEYFLQLSEALEELGYDSVIMSGTKDAGTSFHVTKSVTNETGYAWTSYELTLIGPDATFDYTAAPYSSHFLSTTPTSTVLTFESPNPVLLNETVSLDFDINVNSTGTFEFTLQQNAIPEPLTIALLGLGGLGVLRRKRA